MNESFSKGKSSQCKHNRYVRLKIFYACGLFVALLLYGTLDITIHASENIFSQRPRVIVQLNLRTPYAIESLYKELKHGETYRYSEGELEEEHLVSDPLTDLVLDSDHVEAEFDFSALTELEKKQIEVRNAIKNYHGPIRVALYVGSGTTRNAKNNIPKVLTDCSDGTIKVLPFSDASLSTIGRLRHDIIFIPGGSAGRIFTEMAYKSRKAHRIAPQLKIRKFLSKGGGYIGICAGAYLAAGGKSGKSPFKISMFKTESGMLGDGYFSGTQIDADLKAYSPAKPFLKDFDEDEMRDSQLFYANGPIFKNESFINSDFPEMKNPKVILRMGQDAYLRILYGKKRSTHRRHQGMPLIVMNEFGEGKVVLSTAHPETSVHHLTYTDWSKAQEPSQCTSEEAKMLLTMVYLAANRSKEEIIV